MAKKVLGKGLSSIFEDMGTPITNLNSGELIHELPLSKIDVNPFQPRKEFKDEDITDLADSIQSKGLLQPILVRSHKNRYQIIAGERRFRAVRQLGQKHIYALVRAKISDREMTEMSLIENIQRVQLSPLEEAKAYLNLIQKFDLSHEDLAKKLNKSRSSVSNTVRLLNLDKRVQALVNQGKLSAGHARAILQYPQSEHFSLAEKILNEHLNVRKAEKLSGSEKKKSPAKKQDPNLSVFLDNLRYCTNCKISLKGSDKKGKLEIFFTSQGELQHISDIIQAGSEKQALKQ